MCARRAICARADSVFWRTECPLRVSLLTFAQRAAGPHTHRSPDLCGAARTMRISLHIFDVVGRVWFVVNGVGGGRAGWARVVRGGMVGGLWAGGWVVGLVGGWANGRGGGATWAWRA